MVHERHFIPVGKRVLSRNMKTRSHAALGRAAASIMVVLLNGAAPVIKATPAAYLYGTKSCIEGENGPGTAYYLSTEKGCPKAIPSYPYLEIDIREQPTPIGKAVTIGPENWAFRCPSLHEGCAQAVSGSAVFDHSTDPTGDRSIRSTGRYELKFQGGAVESRRFEVVCSAPCA